MNPPERSLTHAESQVASRRHVGGLIGVGPETLRGWVERDERNAGARPGLSDEVSAEVRQLRKENAELKRANEILRTASAFFAAAEAGRRLS